jgi:glycosyltransferase involved in cell wall biosynthesis
MNYSKPYYPKITIVTPCYNLDAYLEDTIKSIVDQGYPNLEYIIIDGGSTDGSVDIIKKYADHLAFWTSEKDNGIYDAIQKGFEKSTGEIMGWLNADDMLQGKCLYTIAELFTKNKHVNWIQGINSHMDLSGRIVSTQFPRLTTQFAFLSDGFITKKNGTVLRFDTIQQESTFWTRKLWTKAGSTLNTELIYAGDFELWMRFFRYEKLHISIVPFGAFRIRPGQISQTNLDNYMKEAQMIVKNELSALPLSKRLETSLLKIYVKLPLLQKIPFIKRFHFQRFDSPLLFSEHNYYEN